MYLTPAWLFFTLFSTFRYTATVSMSSLGQQAAVGLKPLGSCSVEIGGDASSVINLEPIARKDGFPRFITQFNSTDGVWNYTFNPCHSYDFPKPNPHVGFGDKCLSVSICKYGMQNNRLHLFTMGIQGDNKSRFQAVVDQSNKTSVQLVYEGLESMRKRITVIRLVCDETQKGPEGGVFTIIEDFGVKPVVAELRHECCCLGTCKGHFVNITDNSKQKPKKDDGGMMLIIVGSVVTILMLVALIGGLCYIKKTHVQFYSKLPTLNSNLPGQSIINGKTTDFRDYEPASASRKKLLPVLEDTMINSDSLEMCQRLGGGIFGDTHLAKWNEMTVAVKRLALQVHENPITPEAIKLMKNEIWFLGRQRHKNIVAVLGLCLDGKIPSIITEYVIGECLKDFLKVQGRLLSWSHRVRMCTQVADGMAFLHSTKPPIIHRDLRCGNLFLSDNDLVKVADFALVKLLQPIREECPIDDCYCRRTMSACPASIRWTAPELLNDPMSKEGIIDKQAKEKGEAVKQAITPACDVYSFAMTMWEIPMCEDPFEEISTETEVIEIVKNGGRPDTPSSIDLMPQYKDLMKQCWDQQPEQRPHFKQIATWLKDMQSQARSYQKQLNNRQRLRKLQESENMQA
ncbi:probable serine/threonine-protein kinase drkC isoform X2 [Pomacea canaliculata]|uniref:probable serine/threonine-protein kinase drkC isoform X2 n=1 Tax=Pomacea canaliculata TaxID=400727 RepID=UPI000D73A8A9|nr:probable serine/threonine-protein kinase drkC isoform X2 [Pomacea canaliculata]